MSNKTNIILGIASLFCILLSIIGLVITKSHWFLLPVPILFLVVLIFVLIILIKSHNLKKKEIKNDDK